MKPLSAFTAVLLVPAIFVSGCSSLEQAGQMTASKEGTGVQIFGAIVVLSKYKASQNQIAIAETKARRAFVDLALKPAYEARAKKLRKLASAPSRPRSSRPVGVARNSEGGARNQVQRPDLEESSQPDSAMQARAELAAISSSWKEVANQVTNGKYAPDFDAGISRDGETAALNFPKVSESQVLASSAAYVPRYIAVSVPAEKEVPGSKAAVMLWDTQSSQLASDTVYALDRTPPTSKSSEIDDKQVQYAAE
jgi:hypothetical protein